MAKKKIRKKKGPILHEEYGCMRATWDNAKIAGPDQMVNCSYCLRNLNKHQKAIEHHRGDI